MFLQCPCFAALKVYVGCLNLHVGFCLVQCLFISYVLSTFTYITVAFGLIFLIHFIVLPDLKKNSMSLSFLRQKIRSLTTVENVFETEVMLCDNLYKFSF